MENQTKSGQLPLASAAMVELKAELSRKKEEFRRERASNINVVKGKKLQKVSLKKKADVWDQKNAGVSARAQKDIEQTELEEDEDALLKSKLILERKCKIYDAISSSGQIPEDDGSEGYLVDFQKKAVDALVEQREMKRKEEEEEEEEEAERKALAEPVPEAENSDEEWVDYTDSLGRSRRCMRKDLKDLRKKDQDLAGSVNQAKLKQKETLEGKHLSDSEAPHLMSDDMYREKMRQKWEDEARQLVEKGQEEIHYSNVQYDEIRTHGVGFYQFSKDQEEREAQMEKLNKLRDETKTARSRTEMIKDKRKALMEARLAKVRERRKLKTKETPSASEDADTGPIQSEADIEEKKKVEDARRAKEEAEKVAEDTRKKFIREWDKKKVASSWKGDGYVESRRKEREAEFAPPSMYFNDTNPLLKTSASNNKPSHNSNKLFPPSYLNSDKKINDVLKSFRDSSSDLHVSDSSDASSVSKPSKVSGSVSSSATTVDTLPIHSIPLPSNVKTTPANSDLKSHTSNSHSHNDTCNYYEALPQPGDYGYHHHQAQYHDSSAPNGQHHGLPSNQGLAEYVGTTIHQPVSWPQEQHFSWPHQQQPQQVCPQPQQIWPQPQQQQWPQHHYFTPQPTQLSAAAAVVHQHSNQNQSEALAYANLDQAGADIRHSQRVPSDATGVKRSSGNDAEISTSNAPKKLKVPKSAILDNRFVLNSEAAEPSRISASNTETGGALTVQAVPYKPGSFTDAKLKHDAPPSEEESVPASRGKTQISGGPMLYTKEQRQQQLLQMKENEGSDNEQVNEKVEEFLKSVRNEAA